MQILKVISLAGALAFGNGFAMTQTPAVSPGFIIEYQLSPKEPKVLDNFMFGVIKANCTIIDKKKDSTDNEENESALEVKILRKSGSFNGICLTQGDAMQVMVANGDKFQFSVESGAKVQLVNKGSHTIKANCAIG